jgi:S-DNA-T family DNA segregation ATPase FtsK/SpoIIIE
VQSIAVFWFILALLHIINPPVSGTLSAMAYLREVYSSGQISSGGIVGALLGNLLGFFLGDIGAVIVLGTATIILLVLVTGRSFVHLVGMGVDKARDYYDERAARRQEYEDDEPHLKPLPPRRGNSILEESSPPDFKEIEEEEDYDMPPILLMQEELDEKKRSVSGPVFMQKKPAEILIFPDKRAVPAEREEAPVHEEPVYEPVYEEEPIVRGLVDKTDDDDFDLFEGHPHDYDSTEYGYDDYEPSMPRKKTGATAIHKGQVISLDTIAGYEDYKFPPIGNLARNEHANTSAESRTQILENSRILEETLRSFKVEAKVVEVSVGPTVTRYDMAPGPGIKVSSIANLSNDLALSLAAQGIRIEAPIPGKSAVGIEIPNKEPQPVFLREIIEDERFEKYPSKLAFAVGKDIAGNPVVTDIARMPHLLIAGATGSGKSVCINTLITSILYKARPDEVKLLMIDPKVVELSTTASPTCLYR